MTNEEIKTLADELLTNMQIAKLEAVNLKMNPSDKGLRFVHIENKEYINPEQLTFEKQLRLIKLKEFLDKHTNIQEEEMRAILNSQEIEFEFLKEVADLIPNFVNGIRKHDEKYMSYMYVGLIQIKQEDLSV